MGSPLSVIKDSSERLSSYLKMRPVQKPRLLSKSEYLSAKLHLFLEKLKRAKPFWMVLTALNANSKETLLMHVVQSTICKPSTDVTCLPSASWSPPFTPCRLKLMACLLQPRMQRRNPRRQWWMPRALPMSLELSRIMQHLWVLLRILLETNMEGKIRELEAELASTQSRTGEAAKALQRAERK